MSLTAYKKKRRFNETPEPEGKEKSSRDRLRFVIQKHDASHVHYDFRLEMEGVLKSWAVPKGPSLNPEDKRLAMMVEDHPYDYRSFEGVIPEGNYGGGTVIVWDEGFYELLEGENLSRKEQEKILLKQLKDGSLKLHMHGQKIRGAYALFLMKGRGERSWILVKKDDEFAMKKDVTKDETSVVSGKTLVEVAEDHGTSVNHPEAHGKAKRRKREKEKDGEGSRKQEAAKEISSKQKAARSREAVSSKKVVSSKQEAGSRKKATGNKQKAASSKKKANSKKGTRAEKVKGGKEKIEKLRKSGYTKAPSSAKSNAGRSKSTTLSAKSVIPKTGIPKSAMPREVMPMLATLVEEPFDDENWIFEIKWDGYRATAYVDGTDVSLLSRNLTSFTENYAPVAEALGRMGIRAVLDGEIVAVDEKGLSRFQSLQNWQNTPVHLQYYVFDMLWLDGHDLKGLTLLERKEILKKILPKDDTIKYSDHIQGKGKEFFAAALAQGLEGMMAKKASSTYALNARTKDWVKVKVNQRQEVVIAGYTEPRNSRKYFGSLMLGLYEGRELVYVGHTGSGFNTKSLEEIYKQLQPLVTDKCPFKDCPKGNAAVTWVKPVLVGEIKFTEWTRDRIARHPIFMGMRTDKKARDVGFEKTENMATIKKEGKTPSRKTGLAKKTGKETAVKAAAKSGAKSAAAKSTPAKKSKTNQQKAGSAHIDPEAGKDQVITLNGHELKLTNLQKPYWKKEGFTKGDMINYYLSISPYMLPYMKDRPQSLNRHPDGITGPNFYQKDVKGKVPDWMQTHKDFSESTGKTVEYLVCSNEASLVYMANLGCIEMHPWHSRAQSWQNPDWCLIDLDPDTKNSFEQVIDVALLVKSVIDSIGAKSYVKTSGSSGIHIYIPLGARYDYDQSKQLAELIVNLVHTEMPDITSVLRNPAKRKGKIYLDFLQNRETQTAAAPYSLRPKPGMPVSTPLDWSEVKKGLTPTTWNALNIFDRLKTEGDLFKPVLGKGINLEKVIRKLEGEMSDE